MSGRTNDQFQFINLFRSPCFGLKIELDLLSTWCKLNKSPEKEVFRLKVGGSSKCTKGSCLASCLLHQSPTIKTLAICFSSQSRMSLNMFIIVRSPFRAKHHVVMQYMAAGPKCPLPPPAQTPTPHPQPPPLARPPRPDPPPLQKTAWLVEDKEDQEELINKEELMTLKLLQRCKGLRTAVALSTASRRESRAICCASQIWRHNRVNNNNSHGDLTRGKQRKTALCCQQRKIYKFSKK